MEKEIKIGKMYLTRDGRKAFVYYQNSVTRFFSVIVVGTTDMYSVDETGSYSMMNGHHNHNDLVKAI